MTNNLLELLSVLKGTVGIQECLLVGRDGFVIEHIGSMEADSIGAIISTSVGTIESMGIDSNQGDLFEFMVEYHNGNIIIAPIGRDAILGIVANKSGNLGAIRMAVKKSIREIEQSI